MSTVKQIAAQEVVTLAKQASYQEIVEFLDKQWAPAGDNKSLERMRKLDKLFGNLSQKIPSILIAGTNGKSLTAHFVAKLLKREGLSVGLFLSPHILTYNERIGCDNELIANKTFTELANEVINTAQSAHATVTTQEILTQMALNYFVSQKVDVIILEAQQAPAFDATALCCPKITAITRLAESELSDTMLEQYVQEIAKGSHLISADQNKSNLKQMSEWAQAAGAHWTMPVRKLVPLTYPFEQLHGRCAALAERIASVFVNDYTPENVIPEHSLLAHQKGQRGRPTLEAKRNLELNPRQTIEQFWKEVISDLPGRFQLLEKEKPTILLDNAQNLDAFENLLLGIRLLHYQRPLKGLVMIIGCQETGINVEQFAKQIRYFFKKTAGQLIICPVVPKTDNNRPSWNLETINDALKAVKVKARLAHSFREAFEVAKKQVNDRNGLIAIAGSPALLQEYWASKGIKKL